MSARGELAPEGDRGEGVPGVAEGGEKQAAAPRPTASAGPGPTGARVAQTSSASSRIMRRRASASGATGVVISVPTPASR